MNQRDLDACWERYRQTPNNVDRNQLAETYLSYAYARAWRWAPSIDWDERKSAAHWILLKAIPQFVRSGGASFEYFLARYIPFNLRDHFFKNADCPDRALRAGAQMTELHADLPGSDGESAIRLACVLDALNSVSAADRELVCKTVLGHARLADIAKQRGWGETRTMYQRKAALLKMKTGGRYRISWTQLIPGKGLERCCG